MLRKLLLASVGAVALAGSALAADLPSRAPPPVYLPPAPIFTWTGVYIGGQIGYSWGTQHYDFNDSFFGRFGNFGYNTNGVIGGAHVGYNLQLAQWVLGLEGDVDGSSNSKTFNSSVFHPVVGAFNDAIHTNASIEGSIRGRVGIAFDRVLLYGTGGVAFGGFNNSFRTSGFLIGFPGGYDSVSTTRVGWTAGGGVEYAVTNNWSVRAEYRYTDFGRSTFYPVNAFGFTGGDFVNRHFTENRVQVGFSYKFDTYRPAPVVAKY